jgi:poly-gamma-glutamate capsule biosynthesis protein CapA/YwtB (metallophosphatase superfamily)
MKKLFLVFLLLLSACTSKNPPYTGPTDTIKQDMVAFPISTTIDLVMVGDTVVHSNVYKDAKQSDGSYDFTGQLSKMKPIIEPYDLAFYNQETILGGTALIPSNYPRFNTPQEFGDAMLDAGFNLVSLANNHTNDMGTKGILASDVYWKTKPEAITAGAYATQAESKAVPVHELNGIKIGFLAYTYGINGTYLSEENAFMVPRINLDKMEEDCNALRPLVDVLIVSVHFGSEYTNTPNQYQKNVVNKLASLGVDIVIGNHAHAIQPIQWIGKTLVYYALGNFISGQDGTERLIGLTSAIEITKTVYGNETIVTLDNLRADLNFTYYNKSKLKVKIYPWDEVTEALVPNKAAWEAKYLSVVNAYGANVTFGGLRK